MTVKKLSELIPDEHNANLGTERGAAMLDKSLRQYGAGRSILVDKHGTVIAGNKTLERAIDVGLEDVVIVQIDGSKLVAVQRMDLDLATDPAARELAYADNRVGQASLDFDVEQLAADIEAGIDLSGLWHDFELEELFAGIDGHEPLEDPGPQVDKAAELQEKWQIERGQIWEVGRHRVMCGDSTCAEDVERLMGGEKAQAVVTDPPFGVRGEKWDEFVGQQAFIDFMTGWLGIGKGISDVVVTFMADKNVPLLLVAAERAMLPYRRALIWRKPPGSQFAGASLDGYWFDFEIIQVFGKPRFKPRKDTRMSVFEYRTVINQEHGCEKPTALIAELVRGYCEQGAITIDLFVATGTTIVACEQTARIGYGMEIEPKYVAVTLERLSGMGLEPKLLKCNSSESVDYARK